MFGECLSSQFDDLVLFKFRCAFSIKWSCEIVNDRINQDNVVAAFNCIVLTIKVTL